MFRVVAVDLDGTLLRSDKTVSARTVCALRQTAAAGVRVVIVTARPPRFVRTLADETGLGGVAVCSNGAIIHHLATDVHDVVGPLSLAVAARAAEAIAEVMVGAAFALETGRRSLIGPGYAHAASIDDDDENHVADLWGTSDDCVKLLAWSAATVTDDFLERIADRVPEVIVSYSGANGMIEISAAGVTKDATLARLCDSWGVGPAEVIAFGDAPNDISMLQWAGTGVAMANAHPAVLACADRVAPSNDDDGVAMILEELFVVPAF